MFNIAKYRNIEAFAKKNSHKNIKIVSISKNHSLKSVNEAISHGIRIFGENKVQEARDKFVNLRDIHKDIELHLTGPLQTNKVKLALKIFDVFQTLDREKLAKEFSKYPDLIDKKKFFIQINIGEEKSKNGAPLKEADEFIKYCKLKLKIPILGLMCIPPIDEDEKYYFEKLKKIATRNQILNLSMGMSSDYKIGILSGATHVRIGTKFFGKRL